MRHEFMGSVLLLALVSPAGCGRGQAPPTPTAGHPAMGMMGTTEAMGDACPMQIPGTTVQTNDTPEGAAMTFMTTGDVAGVRARVHAMADRMNTRASGNMGMMMGGAADGGATATGGESMGGGMHGMMMGGGSTMMMMPAMRAQVDDIDGGARLRAAPVDRSRVDEMRQQMQRRAQMMSERRGCSTEAL
jgi:hypothetical protein